jgi:hypothetical protein
MSIGSVGRNKLGQPSSRHEELIEFILKRILQKYWHNTEIRRIFYKVIVGGQNVQRCCTGSDSDVGTSSDIDIDFVVIDEQQMPLVRRKRMDFLQAIVKDTDLLKEARRHGARLEIQVLRLHKNHEARYAEVVRLNAIYKDDNTNVNLLDTTMYTTKSRPNVYDQFITYFDLPRTTPIPFKNTNGISFASCKHAVYDTFRMLCYYGAKLGETRRANYNKTKFIRMVAKMNACAGLARKYNMVWIYDRIRDVLASGSYPDTMSEKDKASIERLMSRV